VSRFVISRVLYSLAILLVVMIVVFFIFYVLGDPTNHILGESASDAQRAAFREARGFDAPIFEQLVRFLGNAATLQFGTSYTLGRPAMAVVLDTLPRTLILAAAAFVIAAVGGTVLGAIAAFRGGLIDRIVVLFSTAISSVTEFWVGLLLVILVSVELGLLPTSGYGLDGRILLPAFTLALAPLGRLAFVVRANMLVALESSHVSPALARGLSQRVVLVKHILRNASLPSIAIGGSELTRMVVGGSVVVESVFAWPGMGLLFLQAMKSYDLPIVTATMFVGAIFVLVLNLALDLLYARIDHRVSYE
jgi:peptide/nickel transport system permease protein